MGFRAGFGFGSCHSDYGDGSPEEGNLHRQAADLAATWPRPEGGAPMNCSKRRRMNNEMKISKFDFLLAFTAVAALALISAGPANAAPPRHPAATMAQPQQTAAADSDKTLAAMQDELDRARTRLELTIPGTNEPARPYYVQYRILDLDVRTIVAEFGALVSSTRGRNRIMSVDVRVGNNNLDSSNFITDEGFSGFLGSTGTGGLGREYDFPRASRLPASR